MPLSVIIQYPRKGSMKPKSKKIANTLANIIVPMIALYLFLTMIVGLNFSLSEIVVFIVSLSSEEIIIYSLLLLFFES